MKIIFLLLVLVNIFTAINSYAVENSDNSLTVARERRSSQPGKTRAAAGAVGDEEYEDYDEEYTDEGFEETGPTAEETNGRYETADRGDQVINKVENVDGNDDKKAENSKAKEDGVVDIIQRKEEDNNKADTGIDESLTPAFEAEQDYETETGNEPADEKEEEKEIIENETDAGKEKPAKDTIVEEVKRPVVGYQPADNEMLLIPQPQTKIPTMPIVEPARQPNAVHIETPIRAPIRSQSRPTINSPIRLATGAPNRVLNRLPNRPTNLATNLRPSNRKLRRRKNPTKRQPSKTASKSGQSQRCVRRTANKRRARN